MKIFKVERTDNWSYDEYDSFVCIANSSEEARWLTPDPEYKMWKDGVYCYSYGEQEPVKYSWSWTKDPRTLEVTELDPIAISEPTVILASFNAG